MISRSSLLILVACAEEPTRTVPAADDTGTSTTDSCPAGFYDGPVAVDTSSVGCGADRLFLEGETFGWASGGFLFVQETGADPTAQWSEEHDVEDTWFDPCGEWCVIEQQLVPVAEREDWARNERTAFACADDGLRSYAVGVYDGDGAFADCVAWGHDPEGLVAGTAGARANEPSMDLSVCGILAPQ